MNYLYNDKNEFCGFGYSNNKDSTTVPVKPFLTIANAIYDGNNWKYEYEPLINTNIEKRMSNWFYVIELLNNNFGQCHFSSGSYIKEKSDKISILIPCYGKAQWVKKAVYSCITQTLQAYEIIVLLMDEKSQKLKTYLSEMSENVKCVISEQKNPCEARTFLVELCKTEYFVFLDADDSLQDNFLEIMFKEKGSIVFPFTNIQKRMLQLGKGSLFKECIGQNLTALLCKEAFYEIGLDENLCWGGEDTDFIIRLFAQKKWFINWTSKTCLYYFHVDTNALTKRESFFDCQFNNLKKNRNLLLENLNKTLPYYDSVLSILNDDSNFENKETLKKAFYSKIVKNTCSDNYIRILNAAEKSRQKNSIGIFKKEDFYIPNTFEEIEVEQFENFAFDVIIASDIQHGNYVVNETCIMRKEIKNKLDLQKNIPEDEKLLFLLNNYSCFLYPAKKNMSEIVFLPKVLNRPVNFELHKECNYNCEYCNQKKYFQNHISDDEMFEKFDRILTHIEKITDNHIIPEILGGEPTLWSDYLINKILKRLEKYEVIRVFSNHIIKTSAWETSPKVVFLNHIVNYKNAIHIDTTIKDYYLIVVTHKEIDFLEEFIKNNKETILYLDEYQGNDENFILTKKDKAKIRLLAEKYPFIVSHILKNDDCESNKNYNNNQCIQKANAWCVDCYSETIKSCCYENQKSYDYKDFIGQLPEENLCKGCRISCRS